MKKLMKKNETIIGLLIILIIIMCSLFSPQFRTVNTAFNLIRSLIVTAIMALPCLLIFIIGGIDLSFMAIGSFATYATVKIFTNLGGNYPIILIFAVSILIGMMLGVVNAFFVIVTDIPIFIVTLATQFVFSGACLAFVGNAFLQVPESMIALSKSNLIATVDAEGNAIGVNSSIILVIVLYVVIALMLRYTKFGRTLYAIGSDKDAARRVGINVKRNMAATFALAGGIAALAGVLNASLLRLAVPGDLVGGELLVIAAVILGGADAALGKGSAVGALLGSILIIIISNTLNLLKIPTFWQTAVIGVVIILGTIFSSLMNHKKHRLKTGQQKG